MVDRSWRSLLKVGGLSIIFAGVISLSRVAETLYLEVSLSLNPIKASFGLQSVQLQSVGFASTPLPSTYQTALPFIAQKAQIFEAGYVLGILFTFLLIPAVLAIFSALKDINRNAMILVLGLAFCGIVISFVTEAGAFSLVGMGQAYVAASTDSQRDAFVAAYQSNLIGIDVENGVSLALFLLSIIIVSIVMTKGIFNKFTAYVGLTFAILGILANSLSFDITSILFVLLSVWFFSIGYKLYRLV